MVLLLVKLGDLNLRSDSEKDLVVYNCVCSNLKLN